jgi:hypothetical protein
MINEGAQLKVLQNNVVNANSLILARLQFGGESSRGSMDSIIHQQSLILVRKSNCGLTILFLINALCPGLC